MVDTEKQFPELAMLEDGILKAVLTITQEGICFLSKNLDVLYANPAIGSGCCSES